MRQFMLGGWKPKIEDLLKQKDTCVIRPDYVVIGRQYEVEHPPNINLNNRLCNN